MPVTDCARFLAEDPGELVAASFTCPWCLAQAGDTHLEVENHDSVAHCVCPGCERAYDVALHAGQVMRLTLAPPTALRVRFGRGRGRAA